MHPPPPPPPLTENPGYAPAVLWSLAAHLSYSEILVSGCFSLNRKTGQATKYWPSSRWRTKAMAKDSSLGTDFSLIHQKSSSITHGRLCNNEWIFKRRRIFEESPLMRNQTCVYKAINFSIFPLVHWTSEIRVSIRQLSEGNFTVPYLNLLKKYAPFLELSIQYRHEY